MTQMQILVTLRISVSDQKSEEHSFLKVFLNPSFCFKCHQREENKLMERE